MELSTEMCDILLKAFRIMKKDIEELQKGYDIINEYIDDSLTWKQVKETKEVSK